MAFSNSLASHDSEPQNVGHLFIAIKSDLFMSLTDFEARMDDFRRDRRGLAKSSGHRQILIPGKPEARCEVRRLAEGLPITCDVGGRALKERRNARA